MADYTLPVVFHIIHQNGPENISDAAVLTAFDNLNDAYSNTNFYGGNDGVDTKIQFCLAKRDPNGNPTTGINRVVSPLTNATFASDIQLKDLIRWNPLEYINIWLVSSIEGGGIAGYAYLPFSHGGPEDGIVMLGSIMPTLGGGHSTLVHEMGHYLGLYHTFEGSCANADCNFEGDLVCDTPPDGTTAPPGDCSAIINSCTTDTQSGFPTDQNDINWNYVDYGNQPCRNGYSQGQADRMGFFIENVRQSLLNSPACQDPCLSPIAASFSASAMTVNIGSTVNFTNTTTGGTTFVWSVNGTQFATTTNASYTFNSLGSFEIMLAATNGDPNCASNQSLTIEVVCPITTSFSTSNLYPTPGETVNFTNNTTGANSYTWSVNGTASGTSANFSNVFTAPGQYNVCLEAGNGLCTEQFCQLVFAIVPASGGDCESSFIRRFGAFGVNEESFFLIPDGTGNYFLSGREGPNSIILQVDPSGNILAQRSFDFTSGNDFVANLIVDDEGNLIGSARDQPNANSTNVFFKLNWQSGTFLWARTLDNPAYNRFDGVFQHPQTGNYFFYGATTSAIDDYIIEMDRNTGTVAWQFVSDYGGNADVYTSHFLTANGIYYAGEGRLGGGLDEIKPTISKFDLNGNLLWAKIHLRAPNEPSRLYNMNLIIENDTIVNCGRGNLTGDDLSVSQMLFYKTNINGDLILSKSYSITGGNTVAGYRVHAIPNGYILQGSFNEGSTARFFVARLNKLGNVVWAKKINTETTSAGVTNPLTLVDGGFVVFAAQTTDFDNLANNDLLFGRISLDGQVVGTGCNLIQDINLVVNNISNPYDDLLLPTVFNANYDFPTSSISVLTANLPMNDIPGCECTEFTPECNETFVTAYGSPTVEEGRTIVAVPEGWVFTAAKNDSLIIGLLDASGHLQWQRSMSFSNGLNERARDMMLTTDGSIAICGTTADASVSVWDNFVLKYDYLNNTLIWVKRFDYGSGDRSAFVNISEHPVSGTYIITGDTAPNAAPGLGCDALWMELNPATGNTVSVKNFDLGSCETFYKPVLASDGSAWYATGRFNSAGGGQDKFRQPITKLDLNGNQLWSRLYLRNVSTQNARMYGVTVLEENAGLFVFGHGDLSGTSTATVTLQFFKTDLQGDLDWAKNYDLPGASNEVAIEAISVPDGFLFMGNYTQGDQDIFLIKTDKNGALQWAKGYGGTGVETANDLAYQNGQIFIIGKTNSFGNGNDDILLLKLGLDGEVQDMDCSFSTDLNPTETTLTNPYDGSHPLTEWTPNYPSSSLNITQKTPTISEMQLCFTPCADTCANGLPIHTTPDALLQNISAQCNGDSMLVSFQICNADSVALPEGTPISFYQNNPTTTSASLLATAQLSTAVAPGACEQFTLAMPLPANQQIFAVVNDNGTTPTPFDLATDFPNTTIEECDFTNNIASFTVSYTPPVLNLGPDLSACDFDVTELDAGPGFASYHWYDGSTEQTLTAWQPGTYSVTVADQCGGTQTDEITLSVIPSTIIEIGMDTLLVCEGDSALLSVSGFSSYQWFPADLVDCPTCPSIIVANPVDTCLIVVASDGDGCYTADTVCLKIIQPVSTSDTMQFCQGDTVIVFGNPVTLPGVYSMVFAAQNGCDSTQTITLLAVTDTVQIVEQATICMGESYLFFGEMLTVAGQYSHVDTTGTCPVQNSLILSVLDTFFTSENLTICEGDTALIFGTPTTLPGVYSMVFASQNSCDSTHAITLTVLDSVLTNETIVICETETADIFGTPTNQPGTYFETYPLPGGCDSTHVIELVVNDSALVLQNLSICAGDSVLIFGSWESQPGIFTQTIPAQNSCDSTTVVNLSVGQSFQLNFETETACPLLFDGSVTAVPSGGAAPYTFSWGNYPTVFTSQLSNIDVGTYVVTVTDQSGCAVVDSVTLGAAMRPEVTSEVENVSCFGVNDGTLTIVADDPSLQFSVQGSPASSQVFYDSIFAGSYQYFVIDTFGCVWEEVYFLTSPNKIVLQLPNSIEAPMCDSVQLEASSTTSPLTWSWSPPDFLSCTDCPVPIASPFTTMTYFVMVTDSNGCKALDSIVVKVDFNGKAYIPNAFSPNSDGINDVFYVLGKCVEEVRVLRIFDRWGEMVFEKSNTPPNDPLYGWDGKFRGKDMNSDVFVYYIIVALPDGTTVEMKGDLTLLR